MGLIYPDDMISIPFPFSPLDMEALHLLISVLFAVGLAALIYAMAGRSPGVLGSFPCLLQLLSSSCMFSLALSRCRRISWTYGRVFRASFVFGGCVFPFYCFFFLHPDFHYMICCVLKTTDVYYGLMYVKISLP